MCPYSRRGATDFLLLEPKRRQRVILKLIRQLASQPFVRSDYVLPDDSGRPIEHLLIEDFVFSYWLDHGARELRIVDIEDAS
ncbi:hypothetical protein OpiT1DRAFT_01341 [Opitutaceae bacterium TAV1]|nr:hypothetical protein OpiT1DRAFT_01341 [Opitutaceae bacterium TAV1]